MPIYEFCAENVTLLEKSFKPVLREWSCVIIWLSGHDAVLWCYKSSS